MRRTTTARTLLTISVLFCAIALHAQTIGDYRSKQTGDWSDAANWEMFSPALTCLNAVDDWCDAATPPLSSSGAIVVRNGHVMTLSTALTVDELTIEDGGQLTHDNGILTIANGTGDDFTIDANVLFGGGTFNQTGGSLVLNNNVAVVNGGSFSSNQNITNNGTITSNSGSFSVSAGTFTNAGDLTHNGGSMSLTGTVSFLQATAGTNLNINADNFSNGGTMTISNGGFSLPAAGTLNNSGNFNLNIANTIAGDVVQSAGSFNVGTGVTVTHNNRFALSAGSLNIGVGATLNINDSLVNSGTGVTFNNSGTFNFSNTSMYHHAADGGQMPIANWDINGDISITGIITATSITNMGGQTLPDIEFLCPLQTGNFELPINIDLCSTCDFVMSGSNTGFLTIAGNMIMDFDYIQNGGNFAVNNNANVRKLTIDASVETTINGGTFYVIGPAATGGLTDPDSSELFINNHFVVDGGDFYTFAANAAGTGMGKVTVNDSFSLVSGKTIIQVAGASAGLVADGKMVVKDGGVMELSGGQFIINQGNLGTGYLNLEDGAISNIGGSNSFIVNNGLAFSKGVLNANNKFTLKNGSTINISGNLAQLLSEGEMNFGDSVEFESGAAIVKNGFLILQVGAAINFNKPGGGFVVFKSPSGVIESDAIDITIKANTILEFETATSILEGPTRDLVIENLAGIGNRHANGLHNDGSDGPIQMDIQGGVFPTEGHYVFLAACNTGPDLPSTITGGGTFRIDTDNVGDKVVLNNGGVTVQSGSNGMRLQQGLLQLNANNVVIDNASSIQGGSTTAYVFTNSTGYLEQEGIGTSRTGTILFPVGKSTYNPASLNNDGGEADFAARLIIDSVYSDGSTATGTKITNQGVDRTWDIHQVSGSLDAGGAALTLEWDNGSEILSGFEVLACAINHHNATEWEIQPSYPSIPRWSSHNFFAALNVGGLRYSRTAYGVTDFSPFSVSSGSGPLPVTLTSFEAIAHDASIELQWVTASELNNRGFEIQKSENGIDFSTIDFVDGFGDVIEVHNYTFEDFEVLPGVDYYYRLKQVDNDGGFEISDIVHAKVEGSVSTAPVPSTLEHMSLYPNPAIAQKDIHLNITATQEGVAYIRIVDALGRQYMSLPHEADVGENVITIPSSTLPNGYYHVQFILDQERTSESLVVR